MKAQTSRQQADIQDTRRTTTDTRMHRGIQDTRRQDRHKKTTTDTRIHRDNNRQHTHCSKLTYTDVHVEKDVDIVLHGPIQQQNGKQQAPMTHSILSSCKQQANSKQQASQWQATIYNDTFNIDKQKATDKTHNDKCSNVCV